MSKSIESISCSVLLLCGGMGLTGCSAIGYNLGNTLDPAYSVEQPRVRETVSTLPQNARIVIQKTDGSKVDGTFLGTGQVPGTIPVEQYGNEFEQWRLCRKLESTCRMPAFGASVQVRVNVSDRHEVYAGRFAGFDPGMIRIQSVARGSILPLKLEFIQELDDSLGQLIATRDEIAGVFDDGVPLASQVQVGPGIILDGKPGIPFDNIEAIRGGGDGRWTGLTAGIFVDIAVIALVVSKSNIEAGPGGVEWKWGK